MIKEDLLRRGTAQHQKGQLVDAVHSFREILRIDPAHQQATQSLLMIAKQLRKNAAAGHAPFDAEAERERRKYEKVWEHDNYRRFSPGLHGAKLVGLIEFFRRHDVRTILDAGCGSGRLMQQIITEFPDEFSVQGFDISENCLDPFFDDVRSEILTVGCLWNAADFNTPYDGIICTDVLEHIPTGHVPETLLNLRRCTEKAAYLGIALFPDGYGQRILGEPLHLTVKEPQWWLEEIGLANFHIAQALAESTPDGKPMWLHALLTVDPPRKAA